MKKQIKKSLSLFLAVLMVLSCWVWVAPQKASADYTTGQYYVKVTAVLTTYCDNVGSSNFTLYYKPNNGTGTEESIILSNATNIYASGYSGNTIDIYVGNYIDGWPTRVEHTIKINGGAAKRTLRLDQVKVYVGKDADNLVEAQATAGGEGYDVADDGWWGSTTETVSFNCSQATAPYINSADAMTDTTLACPAWGSTTTKTTTATGPSAYWDQYGVKWLASVDPTFYVATSATADAADAIDDSSKGLWATDNGTTGYVNIQASSQVYQTPKSTGQNTFYMIASATNANGTAVKSAQKITVSYTALNYVFNGDGRISGLGSIINDSKGNRLDTTKYTASGYYGNSGTFPTNESVSAGEGYTFYGFWTDQQPTSGNASCDVIGVANFAEPCSSSDFASYQNNGGTVSGNYVTYDGKTYYNAGEAWDPTSITTFDSNRTYYGWWLRDDLTVSFYDLDGKYLGTVDAKYGWTQSNITWLTSDYLDTDYVSGNNTYRATANTWVDFDGNTISSSSYKFTKDLVLYPKFSATSVKTKYTVNFIDQESGSAIANYSSADYTYRATVTPPGERAIPNAIKYDLQYSYTFEGWTTAVPASGYYHILLEDADFDENGKAVGLNEDWIVRDDVTYYPVYRRHIKTYAVNFWFVDATGTRTSKRVDVKYGAALTAPIDYVPYTYAANGFGRTFKEWAYTDADAQTKTFGYSESIIFNKENFSIGLNADITTDAASLSPITVNSNYNDPVPTPYTVTFITRNDEGEVLKTTAEVNHGEYITADTVDSLDTAEKYDNGEAEVTFMQKWNVVEGSADQTEYATDDLTSFSPTSHITFEAVYGNPKAFYTVTYVDGTASFSERVLVDSDLPVWTNKVTNDNGTPDDAEDDFEEDVVYVPSMEDDLRGSYVFQGWYDEKQTDTTYSATNGNRYGVQSDEQGAAATGITRVEGNVTLYPQFKFQPFTYTIKFMDYEGKVQLAAGVFEYGQSIEAVSAVANKAAQGRAQDNTYTYEFIGWDQAVPTFCEGKDMTFIAQYKPSYRYYEAKWYNSEADMNAEDGTPLTTTHHTYSSKLYSPAVTVTPPADNEDGTKNIFAGWYYRDADDNEVKYVRGMLITGEMSFYAKYTATQKTFIVTTVVKGVETEYEVADGDKAVIADPQSGYVDEAAYLVAENGEYYLTADDEYEKVTEDITADITYNYVENYHDEFVGWYTDEACTTAFDIENTAITAATKIYARFEKAEHEYTNKQLKTAPTYYVKGVNEVWCSCDPTQTKKEEEIAVLTDMVAPTGTIYLGTKGSWSSTDETGAAATDGNEVTLYANEDTDIIITTNDTGDVNALYNPGGIGKGIKMIRAFAFDASQVLTAQSYGVAAQIAHTVYYDDSQDLTNTANYVVKLGDLVIADLDAEGNVQYEDEDETIIKTKALENGKTYIIYYYVADKAGNNLNVKVRTAKFIYDTAEPEFTVEGNSNAGSTQGTPTYCEKATVVATEADVTVTVNGTAVVLAKVIDNNETEDETDDVTTYEYVIEGTNNYLITVTDKAGNSTSKKIKVADHDYTTTENKATCTVDGSKKEICLVCGYVKTETKYEATGHIINSVVVSATCLKNGYIVHSCSACDYSYTIEHVVNLVEDAENEDYEYVTVNGEKLTQVTNDTTYYLIYDLNDAGEKVLAYPAYGHSYPTKDVTDAEGNVNKEVVYTVVTAATCKAAGKEITVCEYCKDTQTREIPTDKDAHKWGQIKTLKATCTEAGKTYQVCKLCGASEKLADIEATGHEETEWVVTTEATCGEVGIETLQCKKCKAYVDSDDEDTVADTREIAATGRHILTAYEATETFWVTVADGAYKYILNEDNEKVTTTEEDADGNVVTYYQVYKTFDATETADGQITYYCEQCGQEWTKTVEKIVKYTVTFVDEDGTTLNTVTVISGTTITKDDAPVATKADSADGKYEYTFAGWKNGSTTVKLPLDVTSDITLTAYFTESTIIYTHQFMVPNVWASTLGTDAVTYDQFAVLMGAIDDVRVPVATPVFSLTDATADAALKKLYTFEFKGWALNGVITEDFTITGNATFYAVFEASPVGYEVIYYNGTSYVWSTTVNGGDAAVYGNYLKDEFGNYVTEEVKDSEGNVIGEVRVMIYPEKDYDDDYHYSFDKWYSDATLQNEYTGEGITTKTRLYAGFTAIEHTYDKTKGEVTQEADCTLPEETTYTCSCGHEIVEQTAKAKGHNYDTTETGGVKTHTCNDCGHSYEDEVNKYTVKFVNYNNLAVQTLSDIVYGTTVDFTAEEPTKPADAKYTYTFAGWEDTDGKKYTTAEVEKLEITAECTFKAYYTAKERIYRVTYVDVNNKVVQTNTGYKYGDAIPAFTGDLDKITKEYDATYHYVFEKWSVSTSDTVAGDTIISPVFTKVEHVYDQTEQKDATCTEVGGKVKKCACGAEQAISEAITALGHTDIDADGNKVTHTIIAATISAKGSDSYKCTRCGETITITLAELPSQNIVISVYNEDGSPAANGVAEVTITNKNNSAEFYKKNTDENGQAIFTVAAGQEWIVGVTGDTLPKGGYGGTVGTDGTFVAGEKAEDTGSSNCSCSCHKNTFWGILFRFFHKIIKLFTGEYRCCSDPDPRYN